MNLKKNKFSQKNKNTKKTTNIKKSKIKPSKRTASFPYRSAVRRSIKTRKFRWCFLYSISIAIIVAICVYFSFCVLFKIESIEVDGLSKYEKEDIIKSSGINESKNILFCGNNEKLTNKISKQYPYIEKVELEKNISKNEVTIKITEEKLLAHVKYKDKFALVSANGKILEIVESEELPECAQICGIELTKAEVSKKLILEDKIRENIFYKILEATKNRHDFKNITKIDMVSLANLEIVYGNNLIVKFGTAESIENKLNRAVEVLKDLQDTSKGILDVSTSENNNKVYFQRIE